MSATNPFTDVYRLSPSEEKELVLMMTGEASRLLFKFLLYKTAVLRDRAMTATSDEDTKEFKWAAAAVGALVGDFQKMAAKLKEEEREKANKATKKIIPKKKRVFGSDSVDI